MSTETPLVFASGGDASPELLLAARGLAAPLRARGVAAREVRDPWDIPAGAPLIVLGRRDEPALMAARLQLVVGEEHRIDLLAGGERIESFPFFGPRLDPPSDSRRILVRGGAPSRRVRTTGHVLALLRASGVHTVCWGECPDFERQRLVDEIFTDLGPDELMRLFASVAAVLEPADDPADGTVAPWLAAGCGVTAVVHPAGGVDGESVVHVADSSPEGFATATLRAMRARRADVESAVASRAASRILEALAS